MVLMMAEQQIKGFPLPYLKAWRLHRLKTQADLIAESGVGRATIVRAERGDEPVRFANIRKLAAALDVTPEQLMREDPKGGA
jgi:transcriptional regulator with XRE-family HTH domain